LSNKNKKKLLIFLGSLTSGGAERVTVALSKYMATVKKYSVVVVTLNEDEYDFYTLDDSVKRISMEMSGDTSGLDKFWMNFRRLLKFRSIVKQEKPDIVLGMITRQAVLSILACCWLPVKVIVSERNFPEKRKNHSMWELLRKVTYRFADLHVVQTKPIAEWVKRNTRASNVKVIPNSVLFPLPVYKPIIEPSSFLKSGDKLILAVGTLKRQKGFDLLIETAVRILPKYPQWKLIILGKEHDDEGERGLMEQFQNIIARHNLENQILFPGEAGNVGDWYNRAEIFVLSSRYEGFPNVLLEAMTSGVACISFDCDTGPSELIQNQKNGLLVPQKNVRELASSIELLINNDEYRKKLGENALSIREKYSEEIIFEKWSKLF
jgi:glycosyltransferase involved in cell wall biosynthesis